MLDDVRFIIHKDYPVDVNTRDILFKMSQIEEVVKPVVALPDVHFKYSYHTPTGVVVLTKNKIIPKFVNANCGMSFVVTPFFVKDLNQPRMDRIFTYLREKISVTTRTKPVILPSDLRQIVKEGAGWVVDKFGINPANLLNFENEGSLLKNDYRSIEEIVSYLPASCQEIGLYSMGVLGYGNHFVELQKVGEVIDDDICLRFGIAKDQLCFMLHSDSRAFGQAIFDFYSKKAKKLFGLQQLYKKWHYNLLSCEYLPHSVKALIESTNRGLNRAKSVFYWKADFFNKKKKINFQAIDLNSKEGIAYLTSTYCAINFGYANRAYIASVIRDAFINVYGIDKLDLRILHDGNHDALQIENINGNDFVVHRNGASRAFPTKYYPKHPVFSYTGQPVLLPSSLGNPSYLCAAKQGSIASHYSSCHGTGRVVDRGEARQKFKAKNVFDDLDRKGMKIYDYGKGYTAEEAPGAFKDIEKIKEVIIEHGIATPAAKLYPLAALKGWR
ncbi:MAG: RtcB family protein [Candidatus Omnitrophica bacterium]|nr:RtcB family protein [Candidatus Omnitrophota bacterium]